MHAFKSLYLHYGPSTKVNCVAQKLKYVETGIFPSTFLQPVNGSKNSI